MPLLLTVSRRSTEHSVTEFAQRNAILRFHIEDVQRGFPARLASDWMPGLFPER